MMTLLRQGALAALPLLATAMSLKAAVTVVGIDSTAGANWRTAANLDADQEYGTSGYVVYGLAAADSVYTANYDISSGNPNNVYNLPAGVGVTSIDTNIGMWSGNGNFGTLEDPTVGNAITSAPVLANSSGTKRFTVTRSNFDAFRLTVITASGDNQGTEYTVTSMTAVVPSPPPTITRATASPTTCSTFRPAIRISPSTSSARARTDL